MKHVELPLDQEWTAGLTRVAEGVVVRVGRSTEAPLEITIVLTAQGPVVRARAAALQVESAGELLAKCGRFRLEADESVDIVSGGSVSVQGRRFDAVATHGSARVKANDDVQLLGENVLLNCDRAMSAPMPAWAQSTPPVPISLPAQSVSGDAALAAELGAATPGGDDGAD